MKDKEKSLEMKNYGFNTRGYNRYFPPVRHDRGEVDWAFF